MSSKNPKNTGSIPGSIGCGMLSVLSPKNDWKIGCDTSSRMKSCSGSTQLHLRHQVLPLGVAVEVVEDDEAAFEEIGAQVRGLGLVGRPVAGLGHVDDGILEDARIVEIEDVAAVQMDAHVGDVVEDGGEVPIGRRDSRAPIRWRRVRPARRI